MIDENATVLQHKTMADYGSNKVTCNAPVDENAITHKVQSRGHKGSFGSKPLSISNPPKTPIAASNNASRRRALGDISNRKGLLKDDLATLDTRKEKKSSKFSSQVKTSQTPFDSSKPFQLPSSWHETESLNRKTVNFADELSLIPFEDTEIDNAAQSTAVHKFDGDDEKEKLFGQAWYEQILISLHHNIYLNT